MAFFLFSPRRYSTVSVPPWSAQVHRLRATLSRLVLLAILLWGNWSLACAQTGGPNADSATYVGSTRCAACHEAEHFKWTSSHHAGAMQLASEKTVLGRFDGVMFSAEGTETKLFKKGETFWVSTEGPDGKRGEFEIKYTFGLMPLQQYLIELPGGRLQAFGIAWDARPAAEGGQKWFHLYPGRKLMAGDPLHWTGLDQNWNYQCASCHATNLEKNYSPKTKSFNTTWSEISVGCEACHGPASRHLDWASMSRADRSADPTRGLGLLFDERRGVSWSSTTEGRIVRTPAQAGSREVEVCAACHSRREQFSSARVGIKKFFDAFRTSRLEPPLYHPDGQQRDEVFNFGSFLQSKMYAAGVTCSNCHEPHSGKLRLAGNAVCTQCHDATRFDTANHHHHEAGTAGTQCAGCHMPTTVYMGVDARHDHSMRIPRPDRSYLMGVPSVCAQCHEKKSPQWAVDAVKTWNQAPLAGAQTFAEAFDLGDRGAPGAQRALLRVLEDSSLSGLVRASAIARLARYPSRGSLAAIAAALQLPDPHIRTAAIAALSNVPTSIRRPILAPMLRDETAVVRMDAARALAGEAEASLSAEERTQFQAAIAEYEAAQIFNAERPEAQANLGTLYAQRGLHDEARVAFGRALEIDPTFYPAAISLAELERASKDEAAGLAVLESSLRKNPRSAPLFYAQGLSLIRQKQMDAAVQKLSEAAKLATDDPRFAYVYAVALREIGKSQDAIATLKSALVRHPYDRDILMALMSYEVEAGDRSSALAHAVLLGTLEPERTDVQQMIARLRQQRR